ncbi:MAG: HD domain-containing protein [Desulfobacteraceae bacterium]|nr:MAG: HD domain-containing protein [Desulfobacteraceae bacterium]
MVQDYLIDADFHVKKIIPKFRKIFELAIPFLKTRQNEIHTFIVYQYALLLFEKEHGIPEVVIPAAILHDVGWSCIPEEEQLTAFGPEVKNKQLQRRHEVEGATIAQEIMNRVDYDHQLIQKITEIIDGHDTTNKARSINDAITKDADKLCRFSGAGFHIDYQRFNKEPLPYIRFLFEKIDEWFLTNTGKKIAMYQARKREKEILARVHQRKDI